MVVKRKCSKCTRMVENLEFKTCIYCRDSERKYHKTIKGRAQKLWSDARYRAKKKGLEFTLSKEKIVKALKKGICEVLKIPFCFEHEFLADTTSNPWAPSVDRIDPNKGYTDDNVQIVCWIHNQARGGWPNEDYNYYVQMIAKALYFI